MAAPTHVPSRQKGGPVETLHPRTLHWREALMPLSRWTDDRLDDLARQVQTNTDAIRENVKIREELVELRSEMHAIRDDSRDCLADVKALKFDLAADKEQQRKEQAARDEAQHKERKADRRWMIMTALTCAGLVIAALAIFIG